jgi:hypothetical protein
MITEAIQKIQQLVLDAEKGEPITEVTLPFAGSQMTYPFRLSRHAEGGVNLGDAIEPFRPELLKVKTLTGFIDAIQSGAAPAGAGIIHVEDYLNVALKRAESDEYGERDTWLRATHEPFDVFTFDQYYEDPQRFIIALQCGFLTTEDLLYVIKIASNLKAGSSIETSDNGLNQTATIKAGEVRTVDIDLKPRVQLVPLRSFSEVYETSPVMSEFLLRFRQTRDLSPSIALFTVDGQKYKAQIMRQIKEYLAKQLPSYAIIA